LNVVRQLAKKIPLIELRQLETVVGRKLLRGEHLNKFEKGKNLVGFL
jgi:hypothetical protein